MDINIQYKCHLCDYNTDNLQNFKRHNSTQKHKLNNINNKYCYDCNKNFETRNKYIRHKYYHNKYKLKVNDKINNNKNKIDNTSLNKIKHIVNKSNQESNKLIANKLDDLSKSNQEVVTVVNKALTKASTLIKYLMENHNSTPPLRKINYTDCINILKIDYNCPEDDFGLQEKFVREYKSNIFVKRISNSILKLLNHKNHDKQPIWNTDCSRNHYVVKTPSSWNEDKAGIKFTEYIIKPILNYIRQLIHEYRTKKLEILPTDKFTEWDRDEYYNKLSTTLTLEGQLLNETLIPDFLRELSPHLRYLHDELEEIEKFEELEELQENLKKIIKKRTISKSESESESESESKSNIDSDIEDIIKLQTKSYYEEYNVDNYEDSTDSDNNNYNIYIPQKIFKKRII